MRRNAVVTLNFNDDSARGGEETKPDTVTLEDPSPVQSRSEAWWRNYYIFAGFVAVVHACFGAYFYSQGGDKDWPVRICGSYTTWEAEDPTRPCFEKNGTSVNQCNRKMLAAYVRQMSPLDLILTFHLLSFVFQITPVLFWLASNKKEPTIFQHWINRGMNPWRFIEYSISATVMVFVIALIVGVADLWIILLLGACNWSVMIFGLVHEFLVAMYRYNRYAWLVFKTQKCIKDQRTLTNPDCELRDLFFHAPSPPTNLAGALFAHIGGWGAFAGVWAVLISLFVWTVDSLENTPDTVKAIIGVQCVLFGVFGINQLLGTIWYYDGTKWWHWNYYKTEIFYTFLSLTAKAILGWMVYQGTMMTYTQNLRGDMC